MARGDPVLVPPVPVKKLRLAGLLTQLSYNTREPTQSCRPRESETAVHEIYKIFKQLSTCECGLFVTLRLPPIRLRDWEGQ
jgi:hypothetical protein